MSIDLDPIFALALRVVNAAEALGIQTALIGGLALAYHRYPRAAHDIDLGTCTPFDTRLTRLADRLSAEGLHVAMVPPEALPSAVPGTTAGAAPAAKPPAFALNGVLQVRENAEGDSVDVVNLRHGPLPVAILERARLTQDGFRCARLPELIAVKLALGEPEARHDIEELLAANPDADLTEIRRVVAEMNLSAELELVLANLANS